MVVRQHNVAEAGYGELAGEYYDATLHPTCKNFRDASGSYLRDFLQTRSFNGITADIGAGRSIVAEILTEAQIEMRNLVLLDSSVEMLGHSLRFRDSGAQLVVADALNIPFADSTLGIAVACLGDPYNQVQFWREITRCLLRGGVCVFTTPSYEWAREFRMNNSLERVNSARFERKSGDAVYVPSLVYAPPEQCEMIESVGLHVEQWFDVPVRMLTGAISPKIPKDSATLVTVYVAKKQ